MDKKNLRKAIKYSNGKYNIEIVDFNTLEEVENIGQYDSFNEAESEAENIDYAWSMIYKCAPFKKSKFYKRNIF